MFASFVFLHFLENLESFARIIWFQWTPLKDDYWCNLSVDTLFLGDSYDIPKQLNRWLQYKNKNT